MHDDPKRPRRDCEDNSPLVNAILALCCEIRAARDFSNLATKQDTQEILNALKVMANEIQNYTTAVNAAFDAIEEANTGVTASLAGITDDVTFLKAEIDRIQNSPGPISPEDQTTLDASQARVTALQGKMVAFRDALAALDAATERPAPPVGVIVPPTEPVPVSTPGQSAPNPNFGPQTAQQRAAAASRQ